MSKPTSSLRLLVPLVAVAASTLATPAGAAAARTCNWGDDVPIPPVPGGTGSYGSGCTWSCRQLIVNPPKECGPAGSGDEALITYTPGPYTVTVDANASPYKLVVGSGNANPPAIALVIQPGKTMQITLDGSLRDKAIITNNGTFDFNGLFDCQGDAVFTSSGLIRKSGADANAYLRNCRGAISTGSIASLAGTLHLDGGNLFGRSWTITGPIQAAAGAEVRLNTVTFLDPGFSFTGPGRLTLGGSDPGSVTHVDHAVSIPNVDLGNPGPLNCGTCYGTLTGSGTVTFTGTGSWNNSAQQGTGKTIVAPNAVIDVRFRSEFTGGRSLQNDGTINMPAGDLILRDATLTNNGLIDITSPDFNYLSALPKVVNTGTIRKSTTAQTTLMGAADEVQFENSGTIRALTGVMTFRNPNESLRQTAGLFEVAAGAKAGCSFGFGRFNLVGGSLIGGGTLDCAVTNAAGATVSPGSAAGQAGQLKLTYDYTQSGTLAMEIGGLVAGTQHDQLVLASTVSLGGSLQISTFGGYVPQPNDVFLLLDKSSPGAITGTFTNRPEGKVFASDGKTWKISYVGGNGNDVTVTFQFDGVHGDLDRSGAVDVFDVVTLASHIVGNAPSGVPPFTAPAAAADVDRSGIADVFDLVILAGYIVGNVGSLPQ